MRSTAELQPIPRPIPGILYMNQIEARVVTLTLLLSCVCFNPPPKNYFVSIRMTCYCQEPQMGFWE